MSIQPHNEQKFLTRLAKGDTAAFVTVYEEYHTGLSLFARRYLDAGPAADIVAEIFTVLWEQHKQYESILHLRASLYQTTRNRCIDYLRSDKRQERHLEELRYLEGNADAGDVEEIRAGVYRRILQEIDALPPYLREVFKLSYLEGKSNAEIAVLLHMKDATVRTKKSQALDILRKKLSGLEFGALLAGMLSSLR